MEAARRWEGEVSSCQRLGVHTRWGVLAVERGQMLEAGMVSDCLEEGSPTGVGTKPVPREGVEDSQALGWKPGLHQPWPTSQAWQLGTPPCAPGRCYIRCHGPGSSFQCSRFQRCCCLRGKAGVGHGFQHRSPLKARWDTRLQPALGVVACNCSQVVMQRGAQGQSQSTPLGSLMPVHMEQRLLSPCSVQRIPHLN